MFSKKIQMKFILGNHNDSYSTSIVYYMPIFGSFLIIPHTSVLSWVWDALSMVIGRWQPYGIICAKTIHYIFILSLYLSEILLSYLTDLNGRWNHKSIIDTIRLVPEPYSPWDNLRSKMFIICYLNTLLRQRKL